MKFNLLIDGKTYNVELGMGEVTTIKVEGKTYQAETKKTSRGLSVVVARKDYLVRFEGAYVSINGNKHAIEVHNLRRGKPSWYTDTEESEDVKAGKPIHKMSGGEGFIHPSMPGRVVSLKVKVGDSVKTGTPILVLEAMKMQNEIVSNTNGIIREIRVAEGDLVESKDVLVVISS